MHGSFHLVCPLSGDARRITRLYGCHDLGRRSWQLQRINRQLARVPVETAAGRRELPLVPIARDALIEQPERQAAARHGAGASWAGNDLVFTTRTGHPVEPRNLVRSFDRLVNRAGPRKIRLLDLRHMVATLLKTLRVPQRTRCRSLAMPGSRSHSRSTPTVTAIASGTLSRGCRTGCSARLEHRRCCHLVLSLAQAPGFGGL